MVANCAARGANFRPRPRRPPRRDTRRSISSVALVAPLKARAAGRHSEQPSRRPQHVRGPIFPVAADADRPLQPRGDGGVRALAGAARRRRVRAQPLEAGHRHIAAAAARTRLNLAPNRDRAAGARELAARLVGFVAARALLAAAATPRTASPSSSSATARPPCTARRCLAAEPRVGAASGAALERALARCAPAFRILKRRRLRALALRQTADMFVLRSWAGPAAAARGRPAPLAAARDRRRAAQGGLARGAGARLPHRAP